MDARHLQSKSSNQIILSEAHTSIEMFKVSRFSVKGHLTHIGTKSQYTGPNHTGEIDNGVGCQSNTGANTNMWVQILELHLRTKHANKTINESY